MIALVMYCPQCSQQQISDEMRFCSRCGFPLAAVKELVLTGGEVNVEPPIQSSSKGFRGAKKAAWIMIASLFVLFIVGLFVAIDDDFAVLMIVPSLGFGFAFFRLLYAVFFEDRLRPREKPAPAPVASAFPGRSIASVRYRELSAPPGLPIDDFVSGGKRTAEVVQPASVTENTTKLLDDHADLDR